MPATTKSTSLVSIASSVAIDPKILIPTYPLPNLLEKVSLTFASIRDINPYLSFLTESFIISIYLT